MPKRIVVFCDGTWKKADDINFSNVVKLMRAVKTTAGDGKSQVTFYDPGVGTESLVRRCSVVRSAWGCRQMCATGSGSSPITTKKAMKSICSGSAAGPIPPEVWAG